MTPLPSREGLEHRPMELAASSDSASVERVVWQCVSCASCLWVLRWVAQARLTMSPCRTANSLAVDRLEANRRAPQADARRIRPCAVTSACRHRPISRTAAHAARLVSWARRASRASASARQGYKAAAEPVWISNRTRTTAALAVRCVRRPRSAPRECAAPAAPTA